MSNNNKKITITVGIPTYNEENNIANLLKVILQQNHRYTIVKKIHIVDDGSSDSTTDKIASMKDKRIIVTQRGTRKGQTSAQNYIFETAKTDFVLILEADTYPMDNNYIDNMVQPYREDNTIGFIQGNMKPLPSNNLLGHILNVQFSIYTKFVIDNHSFSIPIISGRGGRLFNKSVYKTLRWPPSVPEDDYAGVWCKKNDIPMGFQRNAICYYQRPRKLADYMKERKKVNCAEYTISKYFSWEHMSKYFIVPKRTRLQMCLYFLYKHPVEFILYTSLIMIEKIFVRNKQYTDFWPETTTTKLLLNN